MKLHWDHIEITLESHLNCTGIANCSRNAYKSWIAITSPSYQYCAVILFNKLHHNPTLKYVICQYVNIFANRLLSVDKSYHLEKTLEIDKSTMSSWRAWWIYLYTWAFSPFSSHFSLLDWLFFLFCTSSLQYELLSYKMKYQGNVV